LIWLTDDKKENNFMATIRYLVHDVDAAVDFYTQWFGFALAERWGPALAIVTKEDLKLWLSGPQTSAAKPMPNGRQPEPGGWNRLVLEVDDLAGLVERLKQAGIQFRNEIIEGPGGKQILAEDPSGNPRELYQAR
jgi:catechol 2,3-dioxygenase-like lactoylglutathione lyase family enzyme